MARSAQFARPNSSFPSRQRTSADQRVFKIPKGVHSFDYSVEYNVVVTGGLDQVVRVWNPYMTRYPPACVYVHVCVLCIHQCAAVYALQVHTYAPTILQNTVRKW